MFPVARTISNCADINQLLEAFEGLDPAQLGISGQDGAAWVLQAVTNITFYLYKLLGVNRVGCTKAIGLTAHLLRSNPIPAMTERPSTGKMWGVECVFLSVLQFLA